MPTTPQLYRQQLEDLEIYMGIILERYHLALTNSLADNSQHTQETYRARQSDLELGYGKLFMLQNDVEMRMEENDKVIQAIDSEIDGMMNNYENKMDILKEKRGADLAAQPQEQQMNATAVERYIYLGYYSAAIVLSLLFLYKH
jgi:hypothetical protein